MMGWGWLLYWCAGLALLFTATSMGDAAMKEFVNTVGVLPIFVFGIAYFLIPVAMLRGSRP